MKGNFKAMMTKSDLGQSSPVAKILALSLLSLVATALSSCTVGGGYGGAYYSPNYQGYYGDYGYYGDPYWGGGPYVGSSIVISGRNHRGYYGGHHYSHDWRGRGAAMRSGGAINRAPARGMSGGAIRGGGGRGPR